MSPAELRQLDHEFEQGVEKLELLQVDLETALVNFLPAAENYCRNHVKAGLQEAESAINAARVGLFWIFKKCQQSAGSAPRQIDPALIDQAFRLLMAADEYWKVWNIMSMCFDKKNMPKVAEARRIGTSEVHVNMLDPNAHRKSITDNLCHDKFGPDNQAVTKLLTTFFERHIKDLISEANPSEKSQTEIEYTMPVNFYKKLAGFVNNAYDSVWLLPEDWQFGQYTLKQLRLTWEALICICLSHSQLIGDTKYWNSLTLTKSKADWVTLLHDICGVEERRIQSIVSHLTFDPSTAPSPDDVPRLPFRSLANGDLILSPYQTLMCHAENVVWRLLTVIEPALHSVLSTQKESVQLSELRTDLANRTSLTLKDMSNNRIVVPSTNGNAKTDIDLVLVDRIDRFGLILQLKWTAPPMVMKNMQTVYTDLRDGIRQAEESLAWLREDPVRLTKHISIEHDLARKFQFEALVVGKHNMGMSRLGKTTVPVINETILRWYLLDRRASLRETWDSIMKNLYFAQEGTHYQLTDLEATFNGIKLFGDKLSSRFLPNRFGPDSLGIAKA